MSTLAKRTRRFAAFLIGLGALGAAPSAMAQTCGLVGNSGFESGLTGWTVTGRAELSADAHSGAQAVITRGAPGGLGSSLIPVTAGRQITFQAWAKVVGTPTWAGVGLDFLNASGAEISEINLPVTATSYTLRTATQTVPAGATAARVWSWKSGTRGSLVVDDFCLTMPAASSCGSITNNGFEDGLAGWTNDGATTTSTDARTGAASAATGTAQGGLHYGSTVPATGGQTVSFRVWGKVAGGPAWAGVGIDYLDGAGAEISEAVVPVSATAYTEYAVNAAAPAGTARISVWTWKSGTTGRLFVDDFCLIVSGSGGTDTQAPSVPAGLTASNVGASSFTLSWTASTDNVGVTGYEVFRDGASIGTPAGTSTAVGGLAAGTTYSLRVRARDAAGNWSAQSAPLSVTTTGGGGTFDITVDNNVRHQTIDGFGFFGAMNTWWSSASSLWSDAWGDQVISDLGITIWRNEHYPPADQYSGQDATWAKQLPVVRGLKAKADQYGVDLKFIFTVWSPPSSMKVKVENNTRLIGTPHPFGTKQGGALDPTKYGAFADWLNDGIQLYRNEGIEPYAISPQNEPFFVQSFNSCWYKQEWYPEMLVGAIPMVKSANPNVKIFGSEGMLEMEAADHNWPWFYHKQILDNAQARNNVDILAVHGYSDGVAPTSGSTLGHLWASHKSHFADPMGKPQWMTETSGYEDAWSASPGAFSLGLDIMSGLNNGNMRGWVWWQGSENPGSSNIGPFALMNGAVKGKKYYVSKQFYRYIRPGAVRVGATSANPNVFVSAFRHTAQGTQTIVLANTATTAQTITVGGAGLPGTFTIFRTSATDNSADVGTYTSGASLTLPGRSIVTLQAGGTPLATVEGEAELER